MVVRELFALLGIHTDMASVEKADSAMNGLRDAAQALGTLFVTGVVATGLTKFVRMAADVEETTTLLDTVFGESSKSVQEWAGETAAVVGRSEYKLREFASQIGAITAPMLGTGDATAKLSTDMAQLAVDLASVFNTTDQEAIVALRSGLLGESEPMRRFGVNLLDSQLETFATTIGKTFKGMTEAEKMQLRYQFILKQTALFQGNANKELASFTNSVKFLQDRLADLGIKIGTVMLPFATKIVHWALAATDGFMKLAKGTKIFEAALIALGAIATVIGIKMMLPFAPAIAAALALTAAIGGVIVAAEDLYQFFTGGESVTGLVLERLGARFPKLAAAVEKLRTVALRVWAAIQSKGGELGAKLGPLVGKAVDFMSDKFSKFLDWVEPRLNKLLEWLGPKIDELMQVDWDAKLKNIGDFFTGFGKKVSEFMSGEGPSKLIQLLSALAGGYAGYKMGGIQGLAAGAIGGAALAGNDTAKGVGGGMVGTSLGALLGAKVFGKRGGLTGVLGTAAFAAGGGILGGLFGGGGAKTATVPDPNASKNVTVRNESSVTVNGTASPEQKEEFKRIVEEVNDRNNRAAYDALVPSFGTGKL